MLDTIVPNLAVSRLEDLLREILVDHSRFEAQLLRRIDVILRVVSCGGRFEGRLVYREVVELTCISLVEEQDTIHLNISGKDVIRVGFARQFIHPRLHIVPQNKLGLRSPRNILGGKTGDDCNNGESHVQSCFILTKKTLAGEHVQIHEPYLQAIITAHRRGLRAKILQEDVTREPFGRQCPTGR